MAMSLRRLVAVQSSSWVSTNSSTTLLLSWAFLVQLCFLDVHGSWMTSPGILKPVDGLPSCLCPACEQVASVSVKPLFLGAVFGGSVLSGRLLVFFFPSAKHAH